MKLSTSLFIIAAVFIFHVLSLHAGIYEFWVSFDIVMHFLGGAAMALLGIALYNLGSANHKKWFSYLFVLGFVAIIGVLWEFMEYGLDLWVVQIDWEPLTVRDTLSDLLNDGLGATLSWLAFYKKH